MPLSKDAILEHDDLPRELVAVPEWDGDVLVQGMTSGQRDQYSDSHMRVETVDGKPKVTVVNNEALLAAMVMIDKDGARLFTDAEVSRLAAKSAAAIHRVVEVAERLSGLTETESAEKNSEQITSDASDSA